MFDEEKLPSSIEKLLKEFEESKMHLHGKHDQFISPWLKFDISFALEFNSELQEKYPNHDITYAKSKMSGCHEVYLLPGKKMIELNNFKKALADKQKRMEEIRIAILEKSSTEEDIQNLTKQINAHELNQKL